MNTSSQHVLEYLKFFSDNGLKVNKNYEETWAKRMPPGVVINTTRNLKILKGWLDERRKK